MDKKEDIDDIRGYSMVKFGGILGRQLLNVADEIKYRLTAKIPGEVGTSICRASSFSSISAAASFSSVCSAHTGEVVEKSCFNEEIDAEKKLMENSSAGDTNSRGGNVIVEYTDAMGVCHKGVKISPREQKTDGRVYTPTKRCIYPDCKSRSRVMCMTCNAVYCFPIITNEERRTSMSCFVKHVRRIRYTQIATRENKKRQANGRFKKAP